MQHLLVSQVIKIFPLIYLYHLQQQQPYEPTNLHKNLLRAHFFGLRRTGLEFHKAVCFLSSFAKAERKLFINLSSFWLATFRKCRQNLNRTISHCERCSSPLTLRQIPYKFCTSHPRSFGEPYLVSRVFLLA